MSVVQLILDQVMNRIVTQLVTLNHFIMHKSCCCYLPSWTKLHLFIKPSSNRSNQKVYVGYINDLFRYGSTEGTVVLLSDVGALTSAPAVPLRRSRLSMKLFSSLKVMIAWNEGDGKRNHTHLQITPTQGCEVISPDIQTNTAELPRICFLFLTATARKRIQARLCVTTADNRV